MRKHWTLIGLAAMLLVATLPSSNAAQSRGRSTVASRYHRALELGTAEQFKGAFQRDAGKVRLVALISPT